MLLGRSRRERSISAELDLRLDHRRDALGDPVLEVEDIVDRAIEILAPTDARRYWPSTSCAAIRSRSPARRTLPSST